MQFLPHMRCSVFAALAGTAAFSPRHVIMKPAHRSIHKSHASMRSSSSILYARPPTILCIGETLWDSLSNGIYLGGAPSNVAMHLASLLPEKETVAVASCLGKDQLGNEARRRLQLKGFGLIIFSFMRTGKPVRE